jgi:hypothetical protein
MMIDSITDKNICTSKHTIILKESMKLLLIVLQGFIACKEKKTETGNISDDITDRAAFDEQEPYRITKSITYDGLTVDIIIDKPIGNSFDVLIVYHGTVWSDTQIHAAATTTLDKFDQILDREDMMIISVVYPEENLLMGDNIIYAETAFLWVQNLASNELDIDINRIFLGGHSQGGYLVTRLNTMHRVDGVIANCPGPLDMRYRCRLEEEGTMDLSKQCQQLRETYGSTVDNPAPYDAISLLNFTSGYKSPFFVVQGMEDAPIQLHSWPIFKEAINRCSDCSSIEIVEAPQVGHSGLFESSMATEAFNGFVE